MTLRKVSEGFRALHTRTLGEDHSVPSAGTVPKNKHNVLSECSSQVIRQMQLKDHVLLRLAKVGENCPVLQEHQEMSTVVC